MGKISLARSRKISNPNLANHGDARGYWGVDLVGLPPQCLTKKEEEKNLHVCYLKHDFSFYIYFGSRVSYGSSLIFARNLHLSFSLGQLSSC